jgi:hypothetical protein
MKTRVSMESLIVCGKALTSFRNLEEITHFFSRTMKENIF